MLAAERRNKILEKIQDEKRVVVSELSTLYEVSEETIRRDLEKLEKNGLVTKSYGGAVFNEDNNLEMPFKVRSKKNMQGKKKIAELISTLIEDGDHIILDPSTTAVSIVKALQNKKRLTIVTNSIEVLVELADVEGWDVISSGGTLKENYLALVGERAISGISSFYADTVILSCKGIDMRNGLTDANEMFAQVKQAMLASARRKILAADHTKFDQTAFSKICKVENLDMVVTDRCPSAEWLSYFEQRGIRCLYAENSNDSICE